MNYETEYFDLENEFPLSGASLDEGYYSSNPPSMIMCWILAAGEFVLGSGLLIMANNEIGVFVLALLFLVVGLVIHMLPGFRNPYARRAFVLTFCTCLLVMGLAHSYARILFGNVQNTVDALHFYNLTRAGWMGETLSGLSEGAHAPLPVLLWRILYTVVSPIGDGPWVGILLNTFLVGMAGSVTVLGGRYLVGNNPRNLCRIGNLFAFCGMFWLFGTIFVRDSFALLLNVVVLWACLRGLALPCFKNVLILAITIILCALCMNYVRDGLVSLFVLILFLAAFSWTRRKRGSLLILILPIPIIFISLMLLPFITTYTGGISSSVGEIATGYGGGYAVRGSLGSTLITAQIMPIRIPLGSVSLFINPIPLWNNFHFYMPEYFWIKGWQGIFLVCIVPSAIVSLFSSIKQIVRGGAAAPPQCFVVFYILLTTMATAATSLETRHHGQFLPAFLMLASLPNKTDPIIRRKIQFMMVGWFGFVISVHVLWAVLKM